MASYVPKSGFIPKEGRIATLLPRDCVLAESRNGAWVLGDVVCLRWWAATTDSDDWSDMAVCIARQLLHIVGGVGYEDRCGVGYEDRCGVTMIVPRKSAVDVWAIMQKFAPRDIRRQTRDAHLDMLFGIGAYAIKPFLRAGGFRPLIVRVRRDEYAQTYQPLYDANGCAVIDGSACRLTLAATSVYGVAFGLAANDTPDSLRKVIDRLYDSMSYSYYVHPKTIIATAGVNVVPIEPAYAMDCL